MSNIDYEPKDSDREFRQSSRRAAPDGTDGKREVRKGRPRHYLLAAALSLIFGCGVLLLQFGSWRLGDGIDREKAPTATGQAVQPGKESPPTGLPGKAEKDVRQKSKEIMPSSMPPNLDTQNGADVKRVPISEITMVDERGVWKMRGLPAYTRKHRPGAEEGLAPYSIGK